MKILPALVLLATASTAHAQDAPVVQIRSAIGASTYLHGDLDYTAPVALVSVRIGTPTVALEPEFAYAWHAQQDSFAGVERSERATFQSIGFNVVRRWPGRVAPYVGGGVGVFAEHEHSTVVSPVFGTFVSDSTRGPRGGVQALGGVDVRVSSRLAAIAQGRYEMRSLQDPGGGSVWQVMGGVAFTIR